MHLAFSRLSPALFSDTLFPQIFRPILVCPSDLRLVKSPAKKLHWILVSLKANTFTVMMGLHGVPGKPHGVWELALAVGTLYIP